MTPATTVLTTGESSRCLRGDTLLVYSSEQPADERTGDASGDRVTLRRGAGGWSGIGVAVGSDVGGEPTLDSLDLNVEQGTIRYRMPLGFGTYWAVEGRIDCDSIWGRGRPAAGGAASAVVLRRVRQ
ncbi:MAG TPA: hypothetical protein VHM30_19745 [Gemmatimonadaceae bacterium]|nr:hypothetical protein [Gemmatimonadaceae bacterium]HEX2781749.1 hypothetical protein [Gemmatimonadaceae bacterium]